MLRAAGRAGVQASPGGPLLLPPRKLIAVRILAKFDRFACPNADVAARACSLGLTAPVNNQPRAIRIRAFEDGVQLCATETEYPDEVVVSLEMTTHDNPSRLVLRVQPPPGASPEVIADYGAALRVAESAVRELEAAPIVLDGPAPEAKAPVFTPHQKHGLVTAGTLMMALASIATTIVGVAIATGSTSDPGTSTIWPFVPFVGMTVFSATYTQVPDCNCPTDRPMSILVSGVVDAVEIAGLVLVLVGSTSAKGPRRLAAAPLGGIAWSFSSAELGACPRLLMRCAFP